MSEPVRFIRVGAKSLGKAYLPRLPPLGVFGRPPVRHGKSGRGLLYTLTAAVFLIGWFIDGGPLPHRDLLILRRNHRPQPRHQLLLASHPGLIGHEPQACSA